MLANRYGHFDPSGRTFNITDPGTPMPWVNVISNGRYGLVVSQNGGGFSFFDDAQHNVLTRWEMDLVRDAHGKFLYLAEIGPDGRVMGPVWSAAPTPCRPAYDEYRCTHSAGKTAFRTVRDGIACEWAITVAPADAVEVWSVTLSNSTARERRLRVSSYMEWCCGVAPDAKREFHRLFFDVKHDRRRRAIIATKNMWDIPGKSEKDHWNIDWPYAAAHALVGPISRDFAVADKKLFLGRYGQPHNPLAMTAETPAQGGFGRFGDACAALGGEVIIPPGGSVTLYYVLAVAADQESVLSLLDRFNQPASLRGAFTGAAAMWEGHLRKTTVESERPDFDLLNNDWLPYQAISGRLWGRTGYYQQSGAFGFRDQLQDSQVWLPIDPARTREQILLHATRMFADGSVNHWWHALADFGNHTACSDDYLWLPFVVSSYLRETGDFAVLQQQVRYMDDAKGGTILDHCTRAIGRAFGRTSSRGLTLIGSCDWNDGLSALGLLGKGESVWLSVWLCAVLTDWAQILERTGDVQTAAEYRVKRDAYVAAVDQHAWDGRWYRCATKDSGEWLGSSASAEGKIHLNPQVWSMLAGTAPADRAAAAWKSVKESLLTPYGPLLLAPAYTTPDVDIGYITRYSPGSRENGGVYMHAATWALAAACKMKDAETAGAIWRSISPPTRGQDAERYWAEPYVTPGNVDGPLSELPGRAGWTWYTGSAAWLNRVCLEWILGIRPVFTERGEGLLIDPCPPAELGKVSVQRTWRGGRVRVRFDSAGFAPGLSPVLKVNGQAFAGSVLPPGLVATAGVVDVEVSWGAPVEPKPPAKSSKGGRIHQ